MNGPRCKCSHAASLHYTDRKGRPTCGSTACGCVKYRSRSDWPSAEEWAVIDDFRRGEAAPESWRPE